MKNIKYTFIDKTLNNQDNRYSGIRTLIPSAVTTASVELKTKNISGNVVELFEIPELDRLELDRLDIERAEDEGMALYESKHL